MMRLILYCLGLLLTLLQPTNSFGSLSKEGQSILQSSPSIPFFLQHSHNEEINLDACVVEETNDESHEYKRKVSYLSKTIFHSNHAQAGVFHCTVFKKLPDALHRSNNKELPLFIRISVFKI